MEWMKPRNKRHMTQQNFNKSSCTHNHFCGDSGGGGDSDGNVERWLFSFFWIENICICGILLYLNWIIYRSYAICRVSHLQSTTAHNCSSRLKHFGWLFFFSGRSLLVYRKMSARKKEKSPNALDKSESALLWSFLQSFELKFFSAFYFPCCLAFIWYIQWYAASFAFHLPILGFSYFGTLDLHVNLLYFNATFCVCVCVHFLRFVNAVDFTIAFHLHSSDSQCFVVCFFSVVI